MKVFVYGTLLSGLSNSTLLNHAKFIGEGTMTGVMYDLGNFPGVIYGTGVVHGELYDVDESTLRDLDYLEGYDIKYVTSSLYVREEVKNITLDDGRIIRDVFVYIYNKDLSGSGYPIIENGDYKEYVASKYRYDEIDNIYANDDRKD